MKLIANAGSGAAGWSRAKTAHTAAMSVSACSRSTKTSNTPIASWRRWVAT